MNKLIVMGGPRQSVGEKSQRKIAVEKPQVSESELNVFFGRVNPATREKHKRMRRRVAENLMIEGAEKRIADQYLSEKLGIDQDPAEEVLSEEEKDALRKSIRAYKEEEDSSVEYDEMCQACMRSLRNRKLFKAKYESWKQLFESKNPDLVMEGGWEKSDEFKEFVRQKGIEFIKENRKIILEDSVNAFVKKNVEGGSEQEIDDRGAEFSLKLDKFIEENRDSLLVSDPAVKEENLKLFKGLLTESGYENIPDEQVKAFYEKVLITVVYEYLAIEEHEMISDVMVDNVDKDMTDEEWEEMLNDAAAEKYDELEETVKETSFMASEGGAGIVTDTGRFFTVEELGSANGVVLRPVPGMDGVYEVDSDKIKVKKYLPRIRVVNNMVFEMQMRFSDKDSKLDGEPIDSLPTKRFRYGSMQEAINKQLLEYQLNIESKVRQASETKISPNEILDDKNMEDLAVAIFGFNLNDKELSKEHLARFARLCKIILKGGGNQMKIRQMVNFARNRQNASVIWDILKSRGSTSHSIDSLIDLAKEIRMGKKIEKGGLEI